MFQKITDDVREVTGTVVQKIASAISLILFVFITFSFLCAAAFIFVLKNYGAIEACFTGAAIFFILSLAAMSCYAAASRKKQKPKPTAEAAKSPLSSALSDPMMITIGLQVLRTVGIKRLLPLLAIGGIALGVISQQRSRSSDPD